jgi:hypothetical protein
MAKRSGLGQRFALVQIGAGPGYDLSGDVGSIDTAETMLATLDVTGLDKTAHERLVGLGDGKLAYTGFFDNAAHPLITPLRGLPVRAFWVGSQVEGDGLALAISGILTNYPVTRAAGGTLTIKPVVDSSGGDLPDWGQLMAYGIDAAGASNHAGCDFGPYGTVQTITAITAANPAVITIANHGYGNGDSVTIAATNSVPALNGDWVVTGATATTFSLAGAPTTTGPGTAGTAQKTSSRLGGVLVALLIQLGSGTNYTLQWQTSADNGVADAYTNVAGLVTPSLTMAAAEARVRVNGVLIKRWNRLVAGGTYTNAGSWAIGKRFQGPE